MKSNRIATIVVFHSLLASVSMANCIDAFRPGDGKLIAHCHSLTSEVTSVQQVDICLGQGTMGTAQGVFDT